MIETERIKERWCFKKSQSCVKVTAGGGGAFIYIYWYSVRITAVELDIFFNGWDAKPCFFSAVQLNMIDVDSKGLNKFFARFIPVVPFSSVTTQHSSHQWQIFLRDNFHNFTRKYLVFWSNAHYITKVSCFHGNMSGHFVKPSCNISSTFYTIFSFLHENLTLFYQTISLFHKNVHVFMWNHQVILSKLIT